MPVKVIVPTPLRQYTGRKESVELDARTVGEALAGLTTQYADLRKHLFTDDGKIRAFVNIYLNDEDIRYLEKDRTPLKDNDVLSIVPSIAGGAVPAFAACPEAGEATEGLECPCRIRL